MRYLARAEIVARIAHQGQFDKGGRPYYEHLKAVADAVDGDWAKTVAWLHDVVEDTPLSLHDLEELGFTSVVVEAVRLLTHAHLHTHADYVRIIRDARGPAAGLARTVKRADIAHNADPARSTHMPPEQLRRRYEKALAILDGVVP